MRTTTARDLADDFEALHKVFPLRIFGGCCGTNDTHIEELAHRSENVRLYGRLFCDFALSNTRNNIVKRNVF
ncbi:MAG: homocysteine S-methyltransferase family protein [Peptococcaceae bacterium]|nr:homocysteine S-methyltransferase family protein [Peptococcaceae bacterium]